ncbi:ABC transporter ATP-binding protein [Leucobacter sp. wl10]|uniref:ABC transporter ATP-binding protein n=1 Tax=Leucobacter sp. wl10 TaxID=2304677 RepID=UPI000E5AD507|nr:ABC transporter ATP-binding protein [Leucobacter sp. wl10]RGE17642.1 ABC transporter ATP-binding protein [Leucobacter sp. wl10]
MDDAIVELSGLRVSLPVAGEHREVLRGIDLRLEAGESLGLVGESGSGKSMTARTVGRLLPRNARVEGSVRVLGRDVWSLRGGALRAHRADVAMVFQNPRAHINPVRTIGDFMTEALRTVRRVDRRTSRRLATEALVDLAVTDPERRLGQYPHELSGGLLQRVLIAAMLLMEPKLLLADEPSTALDVTTQADLIALLDALRRRRGMSMLFITHDLDLAAAICDRTAVMYAGQIVEVRGSSLLHHEARHPYSAALAAARPPLERTLDRLPAIPGRPLSAFEAPEGCAFASRCRFAVDECRSGPIPLEETQGGTVRCIRADELHAASALREVQQHGV